jgi:hypothetical protein
MDKFLSQKDCHCTRSVTVRKKNTYQFQDASVGVHKSESIPIPWQNKLLMKSAKLSSISWKMR